MATKKKAVARKPVARKAAAKKPARKKAVAGKAAVKKATARPKAAAKRVDKALSGGVTLLAAETRGRTGAQAIAPDHSPRAKPAALRAPRDVAAAAKATSDLKTRVEQFLYRQSEFLDNKHWQDYIDLFSDDGVYWMPVAPDQTEWEGSASIFAEDKMLMQVRMGRVTHPNAWSQAPMWATNHVIGNIVIEKDGAKEVMVRSRFHMMELRRDSVRHFGGTYRHTLVKNGDDFRIRLQRVDMFNGQAAYDYVLQIWV